MRHGKKFNHLGRTKPHRKAMLSNMASSLILHKRIVTTVAKAKALRGFVEPLITKAKEDTTHSRRVVFSYLQNKESVKALFDDVSDKVAQRPGGYTRILKTGNRLGDNADMCVMELVDYNEALLKEAKPAKTKTRRSRRGGAKAAATATAGAAATEAVVDTEAAAAVEEVVEEVSEQVEEAGEAVDQIAEEVEEAAEVVEESVADVQAKEEAKAEEQSTEETQAEEEVTEETASEATEMEDESSSQEEAAESGEEE
ncbi:MAG: 50S ribosomal protein L17 [Cyclobacteriaceae bacterium]